MIYLLETHLTGGEAIAECSVDTPLGTKVADVAWASQAFIGKYGYDTPYPAAPEICVEINSLTSTPRICWCCFCRWC